MFNDDKCYDYKVDSVKWTFKDQLFENFIETHSAKYGGSFLTRTGEAIFIKKVIYEKPRVIIIWNDGSKSVASCAPIDEDKYNFESGLNIAINNRLYGYDEMRRLYDDWLPDKYYDDANPDDIGTYMVDIKDVRKEHKAIAKKEWAEMRNAYTENLAAILRERGYKVIKER